MDLAAIAAVLAALGGVLKLCLDALDRQATRQERFLGNHMSKNTRALEQMAASVEKLADRIDGKPDEREPGNRTK